MPDILSKPSWGGIGVLVAVVFGLVGLYYMQPSHPKIWLYFAGIAALLIPIMLLVPAIWQNGFVVGEAKGFVVGEASGRQTAIAEEQPTMQAMQTVVALSTEQLKTSELTLARSTFDTDADGWTVEGGGDGPSYKGQGGDPGGYISAQDTEDGPDDWFWRAPQKFLGDRSAAYGGVLVFALTQNDTTEAYTGTNDIILVGADVKLTYNTDNPGIGWTEYTIPLHESAGWKKDNGEAPTQAEMRRVLSSLTALKIRGEYRSGEDIGSLDSIFFLRHP